MLIGAGPARGAAEGRGELRGSIGRFHPAHRFARLDELRAALTDDAHKARLELASGQQQFAESLSLQLRELTARQRAAHRRDAADAGIAIESAAVRQRTEAGTDARDGGRNCRRRWKRAWAKLPPGLRTAGGGAAQARRNAVPGQRRRRPQARADQRQDRGTFGETQLARCSKQILTREQYAANVATLPGSNERVEFALNLPGGADGTVWLPVDAKFPRGLRTPARCARTRRRGACAAGRRRAGTAPARGGEEDPREIRRAAAYHRFRAAVPADRGPVRGGDPPPGPVRRVAARPSHHPGRADHAARGVERVADGLPHARHRKALERSLAAAVHGQAEFGKFAGVLEGRTAGSTRCRTASSRPACARARSRRQLRGSKHCPAARRRARSASTKRGTAARLRPQCAGCGAGAPAAGSRPDRVRPIRPAGTAAASSAVLLPLPIW